MPKPGERFIVKVGMVVDAETAERLGVEGDVAVEHWADPDMVAEAIFGLSQEEARAIKDSTSYNE